MTKLKVLLLLHEMNLTGAPLSALRTFEALDGVELRTLSLYRGPLEQRYEKLGAVHSLLHPPDAGLLKRVRKAVMRRAGRRLWIRQARSWKPDLIYVNSVAALPLAARLPLPAAPVLLHVKEMGTALSHHVQEASGLIPSWPKHYIAASQAVCESLVQNHGIKPENVSVIHNFISEATISSATVVGHSKIDGKVETHQFTVGGAGHLSWCKGDMLWLQMAAELKQLLGTDKVRFVWVGVTDNLVGQQFRDMARKLGVESLIDFVAVTSEPLKHFVKFDAFALTSWEDSCPAVVLEAMALEKPVVCFAGSGGAPEQVAESGIVVEDFSPRRMAEALARLAAEPELTNVLGQAARSRVLEHFTVGVQVPKIFDVMQRVARADSL